jgi:hypothetical protein
MERIHSTCFSHWLFYMGRKMKHGVCITEQLTPWSRALLKRLTVAQLVKKFLAFYGTRRFITVFITAHTSGMYKRKKCNFFKTVNIVTRKEFSNKRIRNGRRQITKSTCLYNDVHTKLNTGAVITCSRSSCYVISLLSWGV